MREWLYVLAPVALLIYFACYPAQLVTVLRYLH
jgi:hypothetical protein